MITHPVGPYVNDLELDEPRLIQRTHRKIPLMAPDFGGHRLILQLRSAARAAQVAVTVDLPAG
jgi:hypothetical protein